MAQFSCHVTILRSSDYNVTLLSLRLMKAKRFAWIMSIRRKYFIRLSLKIILIDKRPFKMNRLIYQLPFGLLACSARIGRVMKGSWVRITKVFLIWLVSNGREARRDLACYIFCKEKETLLVSTGKGSSVIINLYKLLETTTG